MVVKYPGKLPLSMITLFAKEAEILVHITHLTLTMKSLIVNLKEVITFSTALTLMETDGTKQQLPSMVLATAVTSLAEPERTQVDL
mgnify:CR=1 FL=1